jgi:hypothetical protein
MISLAQTVQLSCTDTRTISECTEMRLHMSHITQEDHWVRPKQFLRLWYVWRKPCTYLAPTLTPYLNGLKRDSTWPPSPRSSIGCVQNDFWAYGTFGVNRAPILHWHLQRLQMDQNEIPHDPCHLGVPSGVSKMISEPMVRSAQTVHWSCIKISTISKRNETSF